MHRIVQIPLRLHVLDRLTRPHPAEFAWASNADQQLPELAFYPRITLPYNRSLHIRSARLPVLFDRGDSDDGPRTVRDVERRHDVARNQGRRLRLGGEPISRHGLCVLTTGLDSDLNARVVK